MPVLMILVIIGLLILWFLLSPFFTKIGSFVYKIIKNSVTEEINKDEKETKELIPIIIVLYISFVLFAWYFLRVKVKVYIDEFVYYPMKKRKRTYKWNEVGMTELVHIKSGYSIKLYDRNGKKICEIPPFYKNQKNFVETVQVHTGRPWMK